MTKVQDVKAATGNASTSWRRLLAVVIITGSLGYALYEWRRDLQVRFDVYRTKLTRARLSTYLLKRRADPPPP